MKRQLSSLVVVGAVPPIVCFVTFVHPARLYAETAPAPPACSAPEVTTCADAGVNSECSYDGGSGYCQSDLCSNVDSGFVESALRCKPFYGTCNPSQVIDCVGRFPGDSCGIVANGGHCATINCGAPDGGSQSRLVCVYTGGEFQPEAGPKGDAEAPFDAQDEPYVAEGGKDSATIPTTAPTSSEDDGCSCLAAGAPTSDFGPAVGFVAAALAWIGRVRRRSRR